MLFSSLSNKRTPRCDWKFGLFRQIVSMVFPAKNAINGGSANIIIGSDVDLSSPIYKMVGSRGIVNGFIAPGNS